MMTKERARQHPRCDLISFVAKCANTQKQITLQLKSGAELLFAHLDTNTDGKDIQAELLYVHIKSKPTTENITVNFLILWRKSIPHGAQQRSRPNVLQTIIHNMNGIMYDARLCYFHKTLPNWTCMTRLKVAFYNFWASERKSRLLNVVWD